MTAWPLKGYPVGQAKAEKERTAVSRQRYADAFEAQTRRTEVAIYLSIYLSIDLSTNMYLSIYIYIFLSIQLSICLSPMCVYICSSIYMYIFT
jgi:hypothetical protein